MSDEEYAVLRLIAATARGLWGHYPFEGWRDMNRRWSLLGQYLARLQELDDRRNSVDRTAERCERVARTAG